MKKIVFVIMSILLLAIVLTGCQEVGKATIVTKEVRATSCDADDICDIKSVINPRDGIVKINGDLKTSKNIYGGGLILTDSSNQQSTYNGYGIAVSNVNVKKMTGTGNAYVCVDSLGNLFRSDTPCK